MPFDLVAVALILAFAIAVAVGFYGRDGAAEAGSVSVTVDGAEAARFPLLRAGDVRTFENRGYTLTLTTEERDGVLGIAVTESDCPNRDCVHTGVITRGGESIVCLPAHIVVRLLADGGTDAVLG